MLSFISNINEQQCLTDTAETLLEKLITFGGQAYPKFGNVFAFNRVGVDAQYFYVKRKGKPPTSIDQLETSVRQKIASYVPKGVEW